MMAQGEPGEESELHTIVDDAWAHTSGYRLSGRVVGRRAGPRADSGTRSSLYRTGRLLLASGEAGTVRIRIGALQWQTRADRQGYWHLWSNQPLPAALAPGWHPIHTEPASSAPAHLLVHDTVNRIGLISDIDDTILISEVNRKRRLLINSLALPPEARTAVPGAAALYAAWAQRNPHPAATPVFYVSASPRQLTDSVRRFLAREGFPRGVLLLKEISSGSDHPLLDQQAYKVQRISDILQAFPGMQFALLGDDGERDPESYALLRERFPSQIAGVWIRRVHPDPQRTLASGQCDLAELLQAGPPAHSVTER
jgi:phosphatidate phosphatase APP1